VVLNQERGVDTEPTTNVEMVFALRGSYFTYDRPKTSLDGDLRYFPSLSIPGRHRLQTDGAVRRELVRDLFLSLNVFYTFDSAPPNAGAERVDVGTVMSLGWSF
jgi:hypothetical protein